jgi:hypothetical protein
MSAHKQLDGAVPVAFFDREGLFLSLEEGCVRCASHVLFPSCLFGLDFRGENALLAAPGGGFLGLDAGRRGLLRMRAPQDAARFVLAPPENGENGTAGEGGMMLQLAPGQGQGEEQGGAGFLCVDAGAVSIEWAQPPAEGGARSPCPGTPMGIQHAPMVGGVTALWACAHGDGARLALFGGPSGGWLAAQPPGLLGLGGFGAVCRMPAPVVWENFTLALVPGGAPACGEAGGRGDGLAWALRAHTGRWLTVGGGGRVAADALAAGPRECFVPLYADGCVLTLRAAGPGGGFLTLCDDSVVSCACSDVGPAQRLTLFDADMARGRYAEALPGGGTLLPPARAGLSASLMRPVDLLGAAGRGVASGLVSGLSSLGVLRSPAHAAMRAGDVPALAAALAEDPSALTTRSAWSGHTLLHSAAESCTVQAVVLAVARASPDVNVRTPKGWWHGLESALHVAVRMGNAAAIAPLVAAGCNLRGADQDGFSPLGAAARAGGRDGCLAALLAVGADASVPQSATGRLALDIAAGVGALPAILTLLPATPPGLRSDVFARFVVSTCSSHAPRWVDAEAVLAAFLSDRWVSADSAAHALRLLDGAHMALQAAAADLRMQEAAAETQLAMMGALGAVAAVAGAVVHLHGSHHGRRDKHHHHHHGRDVGDTASAMMLEARARLDNVRTRLRENDRHVMAAGRMRSKASSYAAIGNTEAQMAAQATKSSAPPTPQPVAAPAPSPPAVEGGAGVECPVCLDGAKDTALVPCGHTLCGLCAGELLRGGRPCPVCRAHFGSVLRVYV